LKSVVNKFNSYFVNIGPQLAGKITTIRTATQQYQIENNSSSFYLNPVLEEEIIDIVNKCKNKTSTDCDDLDMKTIKIVIKGIAKPLTYICSLSFQTGSFPHKMKIAKVKAMYKTGNNHLFTNYRPVSLLPQFSKILEKLFKKRVEQFIEKHSLLNSNQYGFRANRSTSLAVTDLIEEITNATDSKKLDKDIYRSKESF